MVKREELMGLKYEILSNTYTHIENSNEYKEILGMIFTASKHGKGSHQFSKEEYPNFSEEIASFLRTLGFEVKWGSESYIVKWL